MYNFEQSAGNERIASNIPVVTSEAKRSLRDSPRKDIVRIKKHSLIFKYGAVITRSYSNISNKSGNQDKTQNLKTEKVYENLKEDRVMIIREEMGKSGVYCLINKVNGHAYVGSSINLASRMRNYLNKAFLKSKQNDNMPITKALLKYDQSNFTLLIIEYVEPEFLVTRETFYITHIIPYYNVLKQGYSSLGYKHTEETKRLLSELAKNRTHSEETKSLIARTMTGVNNPFYNKNHSIESKIRIIEAKSAYPVYVYNSFKELLVIFPSIKTLANLIKSNHSTLVNIIKEQTIFRGEWYLLNIPYNISDTPLISSWRSKECEQLVEEINKCSHIQKAVFVYDTSKNFLGKYDGVTSAQTALHINHSIIKKSAQVTGLYIGYIFSYERLRDERGLVYDVSGAVKKEYKQGSGYPVKIEDVNCYGTIFPKCFPPVNRLVTQKNSNVNFLYKDLKKRSFSTTAYRNSVNQPTITESSVKLNPWFLTGFADAESCFTLSIYRDDIKTMG